MYDIFTNSLFPPATKRNCLIGHEQITNPTFSCFSNAQSQKHLAMHASFTFILPQVRVELNIKKMESTCALGKSTTS